ncbi:heparin-sulfate lyase HepC [Proteiniphilum sp. X52]|uniref:heparin-sulfate lyase HepC n=1 Tax=Proteiniphilum sp. X52 TaxID=2382159 RepID=UPI000F0A42A0|nr:heparin-sulfate lyase HepC [Proteiniphilum sp. X52]RNC66411.1 heparinase [Proteiniphilum sp. X52]
MRPRTIIYIFVICSVFSSRAQNTHKESSDSHQLSFENIRLEFPNIQPEVFELLDLDRKGLENVKKFYGEGNYNAAAKALLNYYKSRTFVNHPDVDLQNIRISKEEQKWADESLTHRFFAHKGYQPSLFYGEDIDWTHWPVKDNELRWQLHRHKWWSPMGKAYRVSKDEKYAKEWVFQYLDWIEKNPYMEKENPEKNNLSGKEAREIENMRFAWRPLEVSHRLQDQTWQFMYFLPSPHFTPEFLTVFLANYHRHAELILENYSERGNHLLFEAQRVIYAGAFFPEFKDAQKWRKSGIETLNNEVNVQVFNDGFQYELDLHYHLASINIFIKALRMADVNGFRSEFPQSYLDTLERMIMALIDVSFPDYTMPCFSDAKAVNKRQMVNNFKDWTTLFPENPYIQYMASEGKEGRKPDHLSKMYGDAGFYILRNGWKEESTVMVVKAGPPAFWHNQPDNGTFELYIRGRNFFPDAGSYVYGGDEEVLKERNWFRQTRVHNTLTIDGKNMEETNSTCLLWDISNNNVQKLVVENQGYPDLKHRRTIFFVDNTFFVIVDDAIGTARGDVSAHYHMSEGEMALDHKNKRLTTRYRDGNNIVVQGFSPESIQMEEEESWVSYEYRQKNRRTGFAYKTRKQSDHTTSVVTVIHPFSKKAPDITAKYLNAGNNEKGVQIALTINKQKYDLYAKW